MRALMARVDDTGKQTLSHFFLFNGNDRLFSCVTLEPPWKANKTSISCIPTGLYKLKPFNSPKFGKCLTIVDVPGRSEIRIHAGNYFSNTSGCVLPGKDFQDLNKDGELDVTFSSATLANLLQFVVKEIPLTIIGI